MTAALPVATLALLGALGGVAVLALVAIYQRDVGGRARASRRQGPLVVGTTMALFPLAGLPLWGQPGALTLRLVAVAALLAIAWIDIATRLIPTALVALLVALGVLQALADGPGHLASAVTGGALGGMLLLLLMVGARVLWGAGALGVGDAILTLGIGSLVGYPHVLDALATGMLCGGLGALCALVALRRSPRSTLPYAPFLVCGTLLLFTGGPIV